ncbi:DUF6228 family protein [Streptomyces sp. SAS_270]|uniref:DUF6228 family protein n=1 Tax=Streptomyces sp. SAS_270 TaxID=3412748 RepID=UPI00403CC3F5
MSASANVLTIARSRSGLAAARLSSARACRGTLDQLKPIHHFPGRNPSCRKSSVGGAVPGAWRSLERDLTLSAEHTGPCVQLTWGLRDRLPDDWWNFEATTNHDPGEDMRNSP